MIWPRFEDPPAKILFFAVIMDFYHFEYYFEYFRSSHFGKTGRNTLYGDIDRGQREYDVADMIGFVDDDDTSGCVNRL